MHYFQLVLRHDLGAAPRPAAGQVEVHPPRHVTGGRHHSAGTTNQSPPSDGQKAEFFFYKPIGFISGYYTIILYEGRPSLRLIF